MFYDEIAEAIRRKRLDAEAGAGGGAGASGGTSSGGDGGSADGGGAGSSATPSSDSPSSDSSAEAPTTYRGGFFVGYGAGTFSSNRKKKKKKKKLQLDKKGIYENREKLEQRLSQLESALGMARDTTKNIKYVDTHIEILSKLGGIAEDVGLELDKYDESKVLELKNALESAIYQLEEPFEDAIRNIQNQIDELDYEE